MNREHEAPPVAPNAPLTPGPAALATGRRPRARGHAQAPTAFLAQALIAPALAADHRGLVYVASNERRADEIARALYDLAPEIEVINIPPWDCLPYDRTAPSRQCMGRRMSAFAALATAATGPRVVLVSPEVLLQRLPPASAVAASRLRLGPGEPLDRAALEAFASSSGYVFDDRIDEPGEIALLGEVVDVFAADAATPARLRLSADDEILEILRFDPLTQRSGSALDVLWLGAASELILPPDAERTTGQEHRAAKTYGRRMRRLLDLLPDARLAMDPKSRARLTEIEAQIRDAYQAQLALGDVDAPPPSKLYLSSRSVAAALNRLEPVDLAWPGVAPLPNFALARNPGPAFCQHLQDAIEAGRRVVIAGLEHERHALQRAIRRGLGLEIRLAADWAEAQAAEVGDIIALEADLEGGFDDVPGALTLVAAADVLGGRLADSASPHAAMADLTAQPDLRPGDVVIHEEHGLGVLAGLERLDVTGGPREAVRITYHGDANLLAPVEELDRIWRYGAEAGTVSLDRLHTDGWTKRRAELSRDIDAAAAHLIAVARRRQSAKGPKLKPPKAAYARFAARFPYPETADQSAAIKAVLGDLASGRVMRRLVCGDVGFGKTEVALRAAAAAALSGRQVALIAPTTVLARQHFETFRRRFAASGIAVAQLSRLVAPSEAQRVKTGLRDGSIGMVIGTHALAADDVTFGDLGLLIIDEEQRFGAKLKADLEALGPEVHRLTLTATPIPRTLQLAMVGVEDVSLIATPPARRRPIRTFLAPFDPATARTALLREQRRGGQSFVVVPRIADIDAVAEHLSRTCPELSVRIAHGELPAETVDETMVAFSAGDGDVLLATNIIESGLDVPRANTMLLWRADLFGLAQLHQLRGRVGRGRVQGVTYLFHDAATPLPDASRARLSALEAFDRLGAGLAISAQDLDIRGAGDLSGEAQAGHVKLIGTALYQHLLAAAVRAGSGEPAELGVAPELNLDLAGALPESFVPDATVRLNLYARLARLEQAEAVSAFGEELEDRFGPLPAEATELLEAARLKTLAKALGVVRIDAGPKGVALSFRRTPARALTSRLPDLEIVGDRLIWRKTIGDAAATPHVMTLLDALNPAEPAERVDA